MLPIDLDLGFKVFYYYEGFYFVVSILVASVLISYRLKKATLDGEIFLGSFTWILLGAILGARIFHFLFWDLKSILADPLDFIRLWEGGLAITGGLAGGVIVAFICFRREKVDFWHYFAVATRRSSSDKPSGRVGCFVNGDAWGIPTRLFWGVSLPKFGIVFPGMVLDHPSPVRPGSGASSRASPILRRSQPCRYIPPRFTKRPVICFWR